MCECYGNRKCFEHLTVEDALEASGLMWVYPTDPLKQAADFHARFWPEECSDY